MTEKSPGSGQSQEQDLETLRYLQQLYEGQYATISEGMNRSIQYMSELTQAQRTLDKIEIVRSKESLMHVGAGVYLSAKTKNAEKVTVNIGSGYMIEESVEDAKSFIASRLEKATAEFNRLAGSRKEIDNVLSDISRRIDALIYR